VQAILNLTVNAGHAAPLNSQSRLVQLNLF